MYLKEDNLNEDKIRDNLDWNSNIFFLIRDINKAVVMGGNWISAILVLEAELTPIIDSQYEIHKSQIQSTKEDKLKQLDQLIKRDSILNRYPREYFNNIYSNIISSHAQETLKALMDLLNRHNMHFKRYKTVLLDDSSFLIESIYAKVKYQNQSENIIFTGATGTGKSYCAAYLGESLKRKLGTPLHIVFTADQFISIVSKNPPKGTVIIFDEAGAGIASRDFWKDEQIKLMKVWQTMRFKNLIVILTVPHLDFVDKIAKLLMHTIIETKSIDRDKNLVTGRIYKRELGGVKGKDHYDKFFIDKDGKPIDEIKIPKPTPEFIEAYEKAKGEYLQDLYSKDTKRIMKEKAEANKLTDEEIIEDINNNPRLKNWIIKKNGTPSPERIQIKYGVGSKRTPKLVEMLKSLPPV